MIESTIVKNIDTDLAKVFLETITPEFPEVDRTKDKELEFKEMMYEAYINSLFRKQRRKLMNKEYKFSNRIKKQLNKNK